MNDIFDEYDDEEEDEDPLDTAYYEVECWVNEIVFSDCAKGVIEARRNLAAALVALREVAAGYEDRGAMVVRHAEELAREAD